MNKTPMQDLLEKINGFVGDNSKSNSQFYKGLRHAMGMVKDAIEQKLLKDEKQMILESFWHGDNSDCSSEQNAYEFAEKYYNKTYGMLEQADTQTNKQ